VNRRPIYKRVLLKLTGRVFSSEEDIKKAVQEIEEVNLLGVELGIVVGGGNLLRGRSADILGMDRITADRIGMLATLINGLLLTHFLERNGTPVIHLSALPVKGIVEGFSLEIARRALEEKRVVVLSGGTSHPFFTTDTAVALRACELESEIILKATDVDGVYSSDPKKDSGAKLYKRVSYKEAIEKQLSVMDITAFTICQERNIPILVFNFYKKGNLRKVLLGERVGTLVGGE